ncbi:hypothetical protein [Methylobacterium gnaphalii]|uniref:hypothetical protein n=1 Tax=Methylobacterium gnaphalii TaxID=1010610 RepID=UPI0011BF0D22|nr:hypothetical protein [Methylobacterium gnaphalii]GJD71756.1 hypothetical protein MMMDOFMJ_4721 [Methylobacterium gnaphalii]
MSLPRLGRPHNVVNESHQRGAILLLRHARDWGKLDLNGQPRIENPRPMLAVSAYRDVEHRPRKPTSYSIQADFNGPSEIRIRDIVGHAEPEPQRLQHCIDLTHGIYQHPPSLDPTCGRALLERPHLPQLVGKYIQRLLFTLLHPTIMFLNARQKIVSI